jgi:ATP-dependent Lon protease
VNADHADRPLIPVLPLQSTVIYPQGVATVQVALAEHIGLLRAHPEPDAQIVLAFCETETDEEIRPEMLGRIGVISRIIDRLKLPGDSYQVTFQGLRRVEIGEIVTDQPWFTAQGEPGRRAHARPRSASTSSCRRPSTSSSASSRSAPATRRSWCTSSR